MELNGIYRDLVEKQHSNTQDHDIVESKDNEEIQNNDDEGGLVSKGHSTVQGKCSREGNSENGEISAQADEAKHIPFGLLQW